MNQKGFAPIIIFILGILVISGTILGGTILIRRNYNPSNLLTSSSTPNPVSSPSPSATPLIKDINCTDDSQCPDGYKCQIIEGQGTACPNWKKISGEEPECTPSTTITKGICKKDEGGSCQQDLDCYSGLVCHKNICASPIGGDCTGPKDTSCPDGYKCIQKCGPPVAREGDPPPGYYCELEELANKPRNCPICLASNTKISTPEGEVDVKNLTAGMKVYSVDKQGKKIVVDVAKVSSVSAPSNHQVIHLVLADGRKLWVSPNHPNVNGTEVRQLKVGQIYDGAVISTVELIPYWDNKTYDLLPSSETGFYYANGILLGSTLK